MRFSLLISALLLSAASTSTFAGVEAGFGIEHMSSTEYDGTDTKKVKDNGPRFTLNLKAQQEQPSGNLPLFAYKGKLYYGKTTFSDVNPSTISADSKMTGMSHELQSIIRYDMYDGVIDYTFGIGFETWKRSVEKLNGGADWDNDMRNGFFTAGINYQKPNQPGFHGGLGIKYTFSAREDADLKKLGYTTNPDIERDGTVDFRGELGYRVANSPLDLVTYFETAETPLSDGYSLSKADDSTDTYYRNRIKTSIIGFNAMFHF